MYAYVMRWYWYRSLLGLGCEAMVSTPRRIQYHLCLFTFQIHQRLPVPICSDRVILDESLCYIYLIGVVIWHNLGTPQRIDLFSPPATPVLATNWQNRYTMYATFCTVTVENDFFDFDYFSSSAASFYN